MEVPKNIMNQIWEYCRLNNITDIEEFTIKMVKQGFNVEKYGSTPFGGVSVKKEEKIVEVIKEIPIEKIVEKEIYITDNKQINDMGENIILLNDEIKLLKEKLKEGGSNLEKYKSLNEKLVIEEKLLNNRIEELNKELTNIKKGVKKDGDIYSEKTKGGWFGSNILNR